MFEIKKEPKLDWVRLMGYLSLYISFLFILVGLHLASINSIGGNEDVLQGIFTIFLYVYIGCIIFGFVGIVIKLLTWLTWTVTTPDWIKKKGKDGKL